MAELEIHSTDIDDGRCERCGLWPEIVDGRDCHPCNPRPWRDEPTGRELDEQQ